MIAKVIPVKRFPKGVDVFDYLVPEDLQKNIKLGQLVTIPLRKSNIFGLVLSVGIINNEQLVSAERNKLDFELKTVVRIVNEIPIFDKDRLDLLQRLSRVFGVSMGTMAKIMLPPLQKRKLGKEKKIMNNKEVIKQAVKNSNIIPTYTLYENNEDHSEFLRGLGGSNTLIVVPEAYLIDEVLSLLPENIKEDVIVWHSGLSVKEQFEKWFLVKNSKRCFVVGTRGSVFLPFSKLDNIVIDYEHNNNHKHWDQAPRFHVKDVVKILADKFGARIDLASFSISSNSYYGIHKGLIKFIPLPPSSRFDEIEIIPKLLPTEKIDLPNLVNMKNERKGKNFDFFSDKLSDAISSATGDVFLFMHRKGFATSLRCESCSSVANCEQCNMPLVYRQKKHTLHCHYCRTVKPFSDIGVCSSCRGPMTKLQGKGLDFVLEEVKMILGDRADQFDIISISSETEKIKTEDEKKPRILIGTESSFQYIRWDKTAVIGFLSVDALLAIPEFLANEHVWHLIAEVQFRRDPDSKFYIQTYNTEHLILRSIREPDRFYRTDLNLRRSLSYPPYSYVVRYFYGSRDIRVASKNSKVVYSELKSRLAKEGRKIVISEPIEMHPRFYRGQFWFVIIVKLDSNRWSEDLIWLNLVMPSGWRIDPNPISLLSA